MEGRFEVVSKVERIYRHRAAAGPGEFGFLSGNGDAARGAAEPRLRKGAPRRPDRSRGTGAPRDAGQLRAGGDPDQSAARMPVPPSDRPTAICASPQARRRTTCWRWRGRRCGTSCGRDPACAAGESAHRTVPGGRVMRDGQSLAVQPRGAAGATARARPAAGVLRRCAEARAGWPKQGRRATAMPRVADLERELDATRSELRGAIHDLEMSSEEQKAINEEALSVNEEFQSTNEELLTSKEELQSLNEELTALNSQLAGDAGAAAHDRRRSAERSVQHRRRDAVPGHRPADPLLHARPRGRCSQSSRPTSAARLRTCIRWRPMPNCRADAKSVLQNHDAIEREIQTPAGVWFIRRILPYRAHDNRVEGVVITFTDITGANRLRCAGRGQAAGRTGDDGEVALSRRRQP